MKKQASDSICSNCSKILNPKKDTIMKTLIIEEYGYKLFLVTLKCKKCGTVNVRIIKVKK